MDKTQWEQQVSAAEAELIEMREGTTVRVTAELEIAASWVDDPQEDPVTLAQRRSTCRRAVAAGLVRARAASISGTLDEIRDVALAAVDRGVRAVTLPELDRAFAERGLSPPPGSGVLVQGKAWVNPEPEAECAEFSIEAHRFVTVPTDQIGIHSGRRRFRISCVTCGELVHEATTGPREMAAQHLREFAARSRGPGDQREKNVIAARRARCEASGREHVTELKLEDGSSVAAADAIALIDAGSVFTMTPPPGSAARAAHLATGLDLILQVAQCPDCRQRVVFA